MVTIPPIEQAAHVSHALYFEQGGRDVYNLVMNLETLNSILPKPHPDASKRIVGNNRKFHTLHAQAIADYLDSDEKDWVLGTILLGIDPQYVEFFPYQGAKAKDLGRIQINVVGGFSSLEILDGQHRRMAIHYVLNRLENQLSTMQLSRTTGGRGEADNLEEVKDKLESLKSMSIPVSIYAEPDVRNRSRMFAELG